MPPEAASDGNKDIMSPTHVERLDSVIDIDLKTTPEVVDENITDLFVSFPTPKGVPEEANPLTVRAVLIGIMLGSLVNAANVYLGELLLPRILHL